MSATRRAVIAALGIGAPMALAGAASASGLTVARASREGFRLAVAAHLAAEAAIKANDAADGPVLMLYRRATARNPQRDAALRQRYRIDARLERDDELCTAAHDRLHDLCRYPVDNVADLHEKAEILARTWGMDDHDVGPAILADIQRIGGAA